MRFSLVFLSKQLKINISNLVVTLPLALKGALVSYLYRTKLGFKKSLIAFEACHFPQPYLHTPTRPAEYVESADINSPVVKYDVRHCWADVDKIMTESHHNLLKYYTGGSPIN